VIRPEPTLAMIRALDRERGPRLAIYPDGWHMLLRDLGAEVVLDDIAAWIGDADASLPSGADKRSWRVLGQANREAGRGSPR